MFGYGAVSYAKLATSPYSIQLWRRTLNILIYYCIVIQVARDGSSPAGSCGGEW